MRIFLILIIAGVMASCGTAKMQEPKVSICEDPPQLVNNVDYFRAFVERFFGKVREMSRQGRLLSPKVYHSFLLLIFLLLIGCGSKQTIPSKPIRQNCPPLADSQRLP